MFCLHNRFSPPSERLNLCEIRLAFSWNGVFPASNRIPSLSCRVHMSRVQKWWNKPRSMEKNHVSQLVKACFGLSWVKIQVIMHQDWTITAGETKHTRANALLWIAMAKQKVSHTEFHVQASRKCSSNSACLVLRSMDSRGSKIAESTDWVMKNMLMCFWINVQH